MANELNLQELAAPVVLSYARELATVQVGMAPALAAVQELFPFQNAESLTYEYWKDQNVRPVMATLTGWDAEASIASRRFAGEKVTGDMPKISRKIKRGEREELLVQRALENAVTPREVQQIIRAAYDDVKNMRDAVLARYLKLVFDMLQNTDISISENGVILTVSGIGVPAANLKTVTTAWTDTTADIYGDEQGWIEGLEDAGYSVDGYRVLTSAKVVRNMLKNDKLKTMILRRSYSGADLPDLTTSELNGWRVAQGLPPIATLDAMVDEQAANGSYTSTRLFSQDRYLLLPPGKLGDTLQGPTVEAMKAARTGVIPFGEVSGIWAGQYDEADPPVTWTKAAAAMFPTFPTASRVISADVL